MTGPTLVRFVTQNEIKYRVAQLCLLNTSIELARINLVPPEIQSDNTKDIAEFAASWASQQLQKPVVVSDTGFYISAVNGFPGPLAKLVNSWFSADDFLRLVGKTTNRSVEVRECLAYCTPSGALTSFFGRYHGHLASKPGPQRGTALEQVVILDGYTVPISGISQDDLVVYWSRSSAWHELIRFLTSIGSS